MKRLATATLAFAAMTVPAFAGNMDPAVMDPEVIEAAAASSSDGGLAVMGIMVAALLLAALSSNTPAPTLLP